MKKILLLTLALVSSALHAEDNPQMGGLTFGPVVIGEERIKIDLNEFPLVVEGAASQVKADWIPGSMQWVRMQNNLMLPRARMRIESSVPASRISLQYNDKTILLQAFESKAETELYFSLFHPGVVQIFIDGKQSGKIVLKPRPAHDGGTSRHLIDYSCAPSNLEVKGMDGEFLTVSCQMGRVGEMGSEEPMLEVHWSGVNCKLENGQTPPYTIVFRDSKPAQLTLVDSQGRKRTVEFSVKIPKKMSRFKLAGGLGPYQFVSEKEGNKKTELTVSGMLYANFFMTEAASLRGFDAFVTRNPAKSAFFNNFGVYFAYDLAKILDNRLQIVALLGFQGLTFAHDGLKNTTFSQILFPQGFEAVYLHSFGVKNSVLGYGMFIMPTKENPYKNLWVRWGKRVFGEINYITWSSGTMNATMWGASVGFPLAAFF